MELGKKVGGRLLTEEQFDPLKMKKIVGKKSQAMFPDKKKGIKRVQLVVESDQKVTFDQAFEKKQGTTMLGKTKFAELKEPSPTNVRKGSYSYKMT